MTQIVDIVELFADENFTEVEIFDCTTGRTVWKGMASEIPDEYLYEECLCIEGDVPTIRIGGKSYSDSFILSVRLE